MGLNRDRPRSRGSRVRVRVAALLAGLSLVAVACNNESTTPSGSPFSVTCNASPTSGPAPLRVALAIQVSGGSAPVTVEVAFGDGSVSAETDVAHTYTRIGSYNIAATARSGGATATCSQAISVTAAATGVNNRPPVPVFKVSPNPPEGKAPLTVSFNMCQSSDPDKDVLSFSYVFGDGNARDEAFCRRSHTYAMVVTTTAKICVTDGEPGHESCQSYTVRAK